MTDKPMTSDDETTDAAARPAASQAPPKKLRAAPGTLVIMALVLLVGLGVILYAWRLWPFTSAVERTENAYVRGQVTAMAPQVNGYVVEVLAQDFGHVKRGQILVKIDDRLYQQQLNEALAQLRIAEANLANWSQSVGEDEAMLRTKLADLGQAQAELVRAQTDYTRVSELADRGSVSMRERDQARATELTSRAGVERARANIDAQRQAIRSTQVSRETLAGQVDQARAAVDRARINLANTVIRSPRDGQIGEASVRVGQYVSAGSQLMFLVPNAYWAVANFKETQTAHIRLGQPASFTVDALGGAKVTGRVEEIAPATGSEFSVLRADNASGNFTKIVQRIPVRIRIDPGQPVAQRLRPGMSIVAAIDTDAAAGRGER